MTFSTALFLCIFTAAADPPRARELAPGVYAMGFSARYGSANVGWIVSDDHVTLIGMPHRELVDRVFAGVEKTTHKPVREVVLTHVRQAEADAVPPLLKRGVTVLAHPLGAQVALRASLLAGLRGTASAKNSTIDDRLRDVAAPLDVGDAHRHVQIIPIEQAGGVGDLAAYVRDQAVLFTGELCSNGPRADLGASDTARWLDALTQLKQLAARTVVPGFGSIGGPELLDRQERYLRELRRQVGHGVAQGLPLAEIRAHVRIAPEFLVWMPYDHPTADDIDHVYAELAVPQAPFGPDDPRASSKDKRPRALALIGDRPHDPAHLEAGLRRAFESAGVAAHFTVDPRALSAQNLKGVRLLVILRDGLIWPNGSDKPSTVWMTPDQERAVVRFVESGGGFLALHNATGLYTAGGPYLKLLGGTYNGHGPLERFRVHVTDPKHPVTRAITTYEVADEQHTPIPDLSKVHIFLESRSHDGVTAPAGWAYEAARGRVCYLANGHTRDALLHPTYQRLLQNAIHWSLRQSDATK